MAKTSVNTEAVRQTVLHEGRLHSTLESFGLNPDRLSEWIRENLETSGTMLQAKLVSGLRDDNYFKAQIAYNEASILLQILEHEKATFKS